MNPEIRRRVNAIGLVTERRQLEELLRAIVYRAVGNYRGEPIADTWPHVGALAARFVRDAADRGAFVYFGVRDGGDLAVLPPLLVAGGFPGGIGPTTTAVATLIMHGGTKRIWVKPGDLEFTANAR